ncbi:YciI family protein [Schaalia hyovaginalis]|uniref:Uncharacterized protein YciI n=1 Tax=Schaalia hyovaginalis TaxID=29316 RepID=A0A923E2D0_9ACTO|nr:YciI family protein [Schaalia hyovaginalis]MBB6334708.1 uncharacterized protein YciI [Schaalia hyovaginalis]MCI7672130.1 YciI family protein [Schaalia hyovaginalis]MDY2668121.1 YciI family protein [Schaalia hyovaginalis]MDY5506344.1 YciI family protein [Schaalia hyovaginalis]
MAYFAVFYEYDPSKSELADEIRPRHRAFLADLKERGANVASGPLSGDGPNALLIFEADSAQTVEELLDEDPFKVCGVVTGRSVHPWNPVISRF